MILIRNIGRAQSGQIAIEAGPSLLFVAIDPGARGILLPHLASGTSAGQFIPSAAASTGKKSMALTSLVGAYPVSNGLRTHRARLPRNLAAAAKQGHGRNAADIEAPRKVLPCPRIDLHQAGFGLEHSGCLLEFASHRPAGSAPRSPEIDHDREIVDCDLSLEVRSRC